MQKKHTVLSDPGEGGAAGVRVAVIFGPAATSSVVVFLDVAALLLKVGTVVGGSRGSASTPGGIVPVELACATTNTVLVLLFVTTTC